MHWSQAGQQVITLLLFCLCLKAWGAEGAANSARVNPSSSLHENFAQDSLPQGAMSLESMAQAVFQASQNKEPLPVFSKKMNLDMSIAYQVQRLYVRSRLQTDKIAGFKAGLTSDDAQAKFSINRPIIGILFNQGRRNDKHQFPISHHPGLMVEAELGFIVKKRIHSKIKSVNELKSYIEKVIPVLELPEVQFDSEPINGMDLVSANTASAYFIPDNSEHVNWLGLDINEITVTISQNDRIILQGQGKDALGDQWEALRWLVNQVLAHGWVIEKGHLLITGALGGMVHVKPGHYSALYNHETSLSFSVLE